MSIVVILSRLLAGEGAVSVVLLEVVVAALRVAAGEVSHAEARDTKQVHGWEGITGEVSARRQRVGGGVSRGQCGARSEKKRIKYVFS